MTSSITGSSSASRVGYATLVTNRGIGKTDPIDAIVSHGSAFATQRDPHSGLADSSIDLSLYALEKGNLLKLKKDVAHGQFLNRHA